MPCGKTKSSMLKPFAARRGLRFVAILPSTTKHLCDVRYLKNCRLSSVLCASVMVGRSTSLALKQRVADVDYGSPRVLKLEPDIVSELTLLDAVSELFAFRTFGMRKMSCSSKASPWPVSSSSSRARGRSFACMPAF